MLTLRQERSLFYRKMHLVREALIMANEGCTEKYEHLVGTIVWIYRIVCLRNVQNKSRASILLVFPISYTVV